MLLWYLTLSISNVPVRYMPSKGEDESFDVVCVNWERVHKPSPSDVCRRSVLRFGCRCQRRPSGVLVSWNFPPAQIYIRDGKIRADLRPTIISLFLLYFVLFQWLAETHTRKPCYTACPKNMEILRPKQKFFDEPSSYFLDVIIVWSEFCNCTYIIRQTAQT